MSIETVLLVAIVSYTALLGVIVVVAGRVVEAAIRVPAAPDAGGNKLLDGLTRGAAAAALTRRPPPPPPPVHPYDHNGEIRSRDDDTDELLAEEPRTIPMGDR